MNKEKDLSRDDLPEDYQTMMITETHHDHEIVMINGVVRWKENPDVKKVLIRISLNDLIPLFKILGYDKNSEIYRKLYREIGYSLSGYWEVFYWDINNEECDQYKQPENIKIRIKK